MAKITAPDGGVYGVFSPTYAAALARSQGLGADPINMLTLMLHSQNERRGYGDVLAGANADALKLAEIEGGTDLAKSYITAAPQLADKGVLDAVSVRQPYVTVDSTRAAQNDAVAQNAAQQAAFENTASGIKYLTDAGVRPPVDDIGAMITPPLQDVASTVEPYVSYDSESDRMRAQAAQVAAAKPSGGGGSGGGVQLTITDDGFGDPSYAFRGKDPEAVRAAYEASRGPGGSKGAGNGGRAVEDVKAQVARAKASGATAKHTGKGRIVLEFPNGRKTQIQVNPDGVGGVETAVR